MKVFIFTRVWWLNCLYLWLDEVDSLVSTFAMLSPILANICQTSLFQTRFRIPRAENSWLIQHATVYWVDSFNLSWISLGFLIISHTSCNSSLEMPNIKLTLSYAHTHVHKHTHRHTEKCKNTHTHTHTHTQSTTHNIHTHGYLNPIAIHSLHIEH